MQILVVSATKRSCKKNKLLAKFENNLAQMVLEWASTKAIDQSKSMAAYDQS